MSIFSIYKCLTTTPSFKCFWQVAETAIAAIEDAAETLKDSTRFVGDVTNLDFKKAVSDAKEILDDGREILVDAGVDASQMDSAVKSTDLVMSAVLGNTALAPKNLQAPSDAHEVLNNAEISETTVSSVENTFVPAEEAVVIETIGQYATPEATDVIEEVQHVALSSPILKEAIETVKEDKQVMDDLANFNLQQAEADAKTEFDDAERTLVDCGIAQSAIDTVEQTVLTAADEMIGQAATQEATDAVEQTAQVAHDVIVVGDISDGNIEDIMNNIDQIQRDTTQLIQEAGQFASIHVPYTDGIIADFGPTPPVLDESTTSISIPTPTPEPTSLSGEPTNNIDQ